MRRIAITALLLITSACAPSAPPIAGKLTERQICQTAGYLIRQKLGNEIKTNGIECTVTAISSQTVEISAGYKTPLNTTNYYTAKARVNGDRLTINTIRDAEGDTLFRDWP